MERTIEAKEVTHEQKQAAIARMKDGFKNIRSVLNELEEDIESAHIETQTSAVWISGNLLKMFSDFMAHLRVLQQSQFQNIKDGIQDVAQDNNQEVEGEQITG